MKGLYKNEMLKLFSQSSFKVIMILAIVFSLLVPIGMIGLASMANGFVEFAEEDYYPFESSDPMEEAYFTARRDAAKWFDSHEIDDWRQQEYYTSYVDLYVCYEGYRLIVEERLDPEKVDSWFRLSAGYFDNQLLEDFEIDGWWQYDEEQFTEEYRLPTDEECRQIFQQLKTALQTVQEKLLNLSIREYYQQMIVQREAEQKETQDSLKMLRQQYEETTSKDLVSKEVLAANIERQELHLELLEKILASLHQFQNEELPYGDWRFEAAVLTRESIYSTLDNSVIYGFNAFADGSAENEYSVSTMYSSSNDIEKRYGAYKSACMEERKLAEAALKMLEYSIANNIPSTSDSSMALTGVSILQTSMGTALTMTTLFLIVAAGMIVAREHSDGTIRLLLIRPKKREKILLSKYLALLSYGYGLLLSLFILQTLISLCYNGAGLLGSRVVYLFGQVFAMPTLLLFFLQMLMQSLMTILLMTVAFFFSVITKRSALSILLPMLVVAVKNVVSTISMLLVLAFRGSALSTVLKYTIFPYFDLSVYTGSPLDNFQNYGDNLFSLLTGIFGGFNGYASLMPLWAGLLEIFALTVFFLWLSCYRFKRQQIKS